MLEWVPEKRATAQQMLEHPWLSSPSTYDYKYTDKQYEVMMLKKQMEESSAGKRAAMDEHKPDMNTVVLSDIDDYACDREDNLSLFSESDGGFMSDPSDAGSFFDSDQEDDRKKWLKGNTAKINNSFTGPYPLDPTDFDHTDKGPNQQFVNLGL